MKSAIKNVRHAVTSDNVIITKVHESICQVRVDAKMRFPKPDMKNTFSKWVSKNYFKKLVLEEKGRDYKEIYNIRY